MSLRFDASGDSLTRTTNLPTITAFTMMGWFYLVSDTNADEPFFEIGHATNINSTYMALFDGGGNNHFTLWNGNGGLDSVTLNMSTWYHIAMTVAGTGAGQFKGYLNGALSITHAGNAAPTSAKLWIANDTLATHLNGRAAAIKIYSAVLTVDEIAQEMWFYRPIRTANLNTWLPCVDPTTNNNATDISGNGYNMTVNGTLGFEDGPPIAWGPTRRNIYSATSAPPPPGFSSEMFRRSRSFDRELCLLRR